MLSDAKRQSDSAVSQLHEKLKPGMTIYTKEVHQSRTRQSREVVVYVVLNGKIENITWNVRVATGRKFSEHGAIKVYHEFVDGHKRIIEELGRAMFPNGFYQIQRENRKTIKTHVGDGTLAFHHVEL